MGCFEGVRTCDFNRVINNIIVNCDVSDQIRLDHAVSERSFAVPWTALDEVSVESRCLLVSFNVSW